MIKFFKNLFKKDDSIYKKIVLKEDEFIHLCEILANNIILSGTKYKGIVGIPRGGSVVGIYLSHLLNLEYIEFSKFVSRYEFFEDRSSYLLVDDIADSGKTLKDIDIKCDTATIYFKKKSRVTPTYFCLVVPNNFWIVFPWELYSEEPNRNI